MPTSVLLLGGTGVDLDQVRATTDINGPTLHGGRTLEDVKTVMAGTRESSAATSTDRIGLRCSLQG